MTLCYIFMYRKHRGHSDTTFEKINNPLRNACVCAGIVRDLEKISALPITYGVRMVHPELIHCCTYPLYSVPEDEGEVIFQKIGQLKQQLEGYDQIKQDLRGYEEQLKASTGATSEGTNSMITKNNAEKHSKMTIISNNKSTRKNDVDACKLL
jgi:hypothetical protein